MLSRAECLTILGLNPKADYYEIENRYTMLIKRYRGKDDPETRERLEQISLAYNILTDRYVEPEPVDPRLEKVVFGKSLRKWQNIWHYGKWPLLAGLAGTFFVGYLIFTIVTNKPADFQLATVGLYAAADDANERIETYIKANFAGAEKIEYQAIPLVFQTSETDASGADVPTINVDMQNQYAYLTKMMAMIAGDTIEVYLNDKPCFDQYAPQGTYESLDDLYARLQKDLPPDILAKVKPLRRIIVDSSAETTDLTGTETTPETSSTEDTVNKDPSISIYGLDVTELQLTEGLGLYSDRQIITIGIRAEEMAKVKDFVASWIGDYDLMHVQQKVYEDKVRATASQSSSENTGTTAGDAVTGG